MIVARPAKECSRDGAPFTDTRTSAARQGQRPNSLRILHLHLAVLLTLHLPHTPEFSQPRAITQGSLRHV
jgi:hypothetical protein